MGVLLSQSLVKFLLRIEVLNETIYDRRSRELLFISFLRKSTASLPYRVTFSLKTNKEEIFSRIEGVM